MTCISEGIRGYRNQARYNRITNLIQSELFRRYHNINPEGLAHYKHRREKRKLLKKYGSY